MGGAGGDIAQLRRDAYPGIIDRELLNTPQAKEVGAAVVGRTKGARVVSPRGRPTIDYCDASSHREVER